MILLQACCNQLAVSKAENNYWDTQPPPPTRSESIQRWLLGRPTAGRITITYSLHSYIHCIASIAATSGVSQAQSLPYQHFQDCHWVQDHQQAYASPDKTKKKKQSERKIPSIQATFSSFLLSESPPRPKTSMSNKVSSIEKYGSSAKLLKHESQDSGNSSLSTPSSKTRNKVQHQQFLSLVNY